MMIYADNAATTKLDGDAFEVMRPFLTEEYGNASQPYSFARISKKALKSARETIATCIGALPEEIYFTSGGTESDNWAIKSTMIGDSGMIITSEVEHHAVLHVCAALERLGIQVQYLPVDALCVVQPDSLNASITKETKLVSIMMVNNEVGSIQPIQKLAAIAHEHGVLLHTDAVQAVGHIPIDVNELGVDMLSASAHKFHGPKGIGFLYIRKGIEIPSYADGGAQEFGKRAGTENIASILGMATALRKCCDDMAEVAVKLQELEGRLINQLQNAGLDFIRNGNKGLPGNISLSFRGADGEMLLHRLDLRGICISTGSACDSINTQLSHVIKAMHVSEKYAKGTVRISLGKYNTAEEVDRIAEALIQVIKS